MRVKNHKFVSIANVPDKSAAARFLNYDIFFVQHVLKRFGRVSSVDKKPIFNFSKLCERATEKYNTMFPSVAESLAKEFIKQATVAQTNGLKQCSVYRRKVKAGHLVNVDPSVIGQCATDRILKYYKEKWKEGFADYQSAACLTKLAFRSNFCSLEQCQFSKW